MKKLVILLLALALCLGLCACGEGPQPIVSNPTNVPSDPAPSDTGSDEKDPEDTEHIHSYKQEVVEPDCVNPGYTINTCECGDTYESDTVEAPGHSWADATCTAPKTCSVCGTTEGNVGAHNYQGGKCAGCGAADPSYVALASGSWVSNKVVATGLSQHKLSFGGEKMWSWRFFEYVEEPDPDFMEDLIAGGYMLQLDGKYYHHQGMGEMGELTFTESGDTVTVTMVGWDSSITLQRISGNQLKVTALTGQVNVAMSDLAVGDVYTWTE